MRILVFSDTHLSDRFEEKKFRFLADIIGQADRVIINGDFWEGYLCTFDQFLASPWNQLFPLLKARKTVYIYGNHDLRRLSDDRVDRFSDIQTERFSLTVDDKTFVFEHGHKYVPLGSDDPNHWPSKFVLRRMNNLESFIVRRLGQKFINSSYGRLNRIIKRDMKLHLKPNELLFCGHTHVAEVDERERFVNTGLIKYGVAQYLWIDDGRIITKEVRYE